MATGPTDIRGTFVFERCTNQLWIELPRPENPANPWARDTETLDCCCDLIRSHQQCIPWYLPMESEPTITEYRVETLLQTPNPHRTQVTPNQLVIVNALPINLKISCKLHPYSVQKTRSPHGILWWWDLIRSKHMSSVSVCHAQGFAGFSGRGNSMHNIILLLKKENAHP